MKRKIFVLILALVFAVCMQPAIAGAAEGEPLKKVNPFKVQTKVDGARLIETDRMDAAYYLRQNQLIKVEYAPPAYWTEQTGRPGDAAGQARLASVDVTISHKTLTEAEAAGLLADDPALRSGNLAKTDQGMDGSSTFRITLRVTYSWVNGSDGLRAVHLCKATGTMQQLVTGSGITATGSNLYWAAQGSKYVNGVFSGRDSLGFDRDDSSPTFSNVQLMGEGVSMNCPMGGPGVRYTMYATRGIEVEAELSWSTD